MTELNKRDKRIRNTCFVSTNIFRNLCRLWDYVEKYSGAKEAMDGNIMQCRKGAPCMLDNKGYRHTLRICNTYFFSVPIIATRTRLCGTLQMLWILYFSNMLKSAVDTRFIHPTYQSTTCSSNVLHWLGNVAVSKVTVVLVWQKLTQPRFKYINVQWQVNKCTYLRDQASVSIQHRVLECYSVMGCWRMQNFLYKLTILLIFTQKCFEFLHSVDFNPSEIVSRHAKLCMNDNIYTASTDLQ
jgi:hypothetical protein